MTDQLFWANCQRVRLKRTLILFVIGQLTPVAVRDLGVGLAGHSERMTTDPLTPIVALVAAV